MDKFKEACFEYTDGLITAADLFMKLVELGDQPEHDLIMNTIAFGFIAEMDKKAEA